MNYELLTIWGVPYTRDTGNSLFVSFMERTNKGMISGYIPLF